MQNLLLLTNGLDIRNKSQPDVSLSGHRVLCYTHLLFSVLVSTILDL